jgi:hypothetical protein
VNHVPRVEIGKPISVSVTCTYEDLTGVQHRAVFRYELDETKLVDSPPRLIVPLKSTKVSTT